MHMRCARVHVTALLWTHSWYIYIVLLKYVVYKRVQNARLKGQNDSNSTLGLHKRNNMS